MLKGKRIIAIVPARGGSKGIPLKNIYPLLGIPLVARVGILIKELNYFDRAIVSTDHQEIAKVAKESGLDVPFYRPPELSGDFIGDVDVLTHALIEIEKLDNIQYDVIVMLQPTSPLRRPEHVTETINKLIDGNWDAVWTVSPTDSKNHPLKQLIYENGVLNFYDDRGATIIARQQLTQLYHRNGAAYAVTRECLLNQKSIMGRRCSPIVITEPMISIDTMEDIEFAEFYLKKRLKIQ